MPMKRTVIAVLAVAALLPMEAEAQTISGTAVAVDGDSLEIDGHRIRLAGIDAPELTQSCNRGGESWQCGKVAKEQLAALVRGKRVECHGGRRQAASAPLPSTRSSRQQSSMASSRKPASPMSSRRSQVDGQPRAGTS